MGTTLRLICSHWTNCLILWEGSILDEELGNAESFLAQQGLEVLASQYVPYLICGRKHLNRQNEGIFTESGESYLPNLLECDTAAKGSRTKDCVSGNCELLDSLKDRGGSVLVV